MRQHQPAVIAMLAALILVAGLNRATIDPVVEGTRGVSQGWAVDGTERTELSLPEAADGGPSDARRQIELRFDVAWAEATGLYLQGLAARATVRFDGRTIATEPPPGNRPFRASQLALLPTNPGPAVVLVELENAGWHSALGEVRIGAISDMRRFVDNRLRSNHTRPRVMLIAVASAALIVLAFAAARRGEAEYLWFGLTLAFWAMHLAWFQVQDIPVSYALWRPLSYVTLLGYVVCAALFMRRLRGLPARRGEAVLAAIAGVLALSLFAAAAAQTGFRAMGDGVVIPVVLVIGAYAVLCVAKLLREPGLPVFPLFFAATCTLLAGAHDWLWTLGLLPASQGILEYIVPIVLAGFGAMLFQRYQYAVDRIVGFNAELEARVAERRAALDGEYAVARTLEQAGDAAVERASLLAHLQRSLAPGIVSLAALPGAALPARLRRSIEDMRLIMDGIDPAGLAAGLSNLRARVMRRVQRSNVDATWPIVPLENGVEPNAPVRLAVLRVVSFGCECALASDRGELHVGIRPDAAAVLRLEVTLRASGAGAPQVPELLRREVSEVGGSVRAEATSRGWALEAAVPLATRTERREALN